MINHLYKKFLLDKKEYKASQKFWNKLCENICVETNAQDEWKIWTNTHYLDGTEFCDGNPIYSLISSTQKKGIIINQEQADSKKIFLSAWMDTFESSEIKDDLINNLVITCELSKESAEIASKLLRAWIKQNTSNQDMEIIIEKIVYSQGLHVTD